MSVGVVGEVSTWLLRTFRPFLLVSVFSLFPAISFFLLLSVFRISPLLVLFSCLLAFSLLVLSYFCCFGIVSSLLVTLRRRVLPFCCGSMNLVSVLLLLFVDFCVLVLHVFLRFPRRLQVAAVVHLMGVPLRCIVGVLFGTLFLVC